MDDDRTLYQRVLGNGFAQLPPILREFHSLRDGGNARGVVSVQHGRGILRRILARVLHLPPQGECIAVDLQVRVQGGREIWVRHFNAVPVETLQWQRGRWLIEKAGPLCFVFDVSATAEEMRFVFSHNEICGFKVPRILSLRVDAVARGQESNWQITVTIRSPLFGLLAEYRGEITPSPC